MKEKSITKLVIMMSMPNVLSMLVNSLYNIVDSFFVAKISEDAMTALSLVISGLRYIVFIIPLAFVLSKLVGVSGVWHAFWVTEVLACAVSYFLYRKFLVKNLK